MYTFRALALKKIKKIKKDRLRADSKVQLMAFLWLVVGGIKEVISRF